VVGSKTGGGMGMGQQTTTTRSGTINVSARQLAVSARQAAYMANRAKQRFHQQQDTEIEKENSIQIDSAWEEVGELGIHELQHITAECTAVDDLSYNGALEKYNPALNRITARQPITLQRTPDNKVFITATTSEDPVIQDFIENKQGNVYATDSILSILMSASRTINSFDIIIRKQDGRIIFDKRHGSRIDYLSVGENIPEQNIHHATPTITDPAHINHPDNLSAEATFINQCFSQQILTRDGEKHEFSSPNPFADSVPEGSELASAAYRYRKFTLPGGNELIVRCTLNAYTDVSGSTPLSSNQDQIQLEDGRKRVFVISRALNEYDSKHSNTIDYRQKLEQQAGAVIASEIKNNLAKLTRWTAEAVVTGAEQVRIGFVSRLNPKSNLKHQLLMTKLYTPATFAQSLNVPVRQLWGTLNAILTLVNKQPDGTYLLLRDANKPLLRLFKVPDTQFPVETDAIATTTATATAAQAQAQSPAASATATPATATASQ
jgi:translation initiation factor 3 subunit D